MSARCGELRFPAHVPLRSLRVKATTLLFAALAAVSFSHRVQAEAFTWHGDLLDGGEAANGRCDLRVQAFGRPGATGSC